MQKRIPAVLMRGGTSKGLFFHEKDLPVDPELRDSVILKAFGSPDPYRRQLDGVGGALPTTSKIAIISVSKDPAYDVVYNFGQVAIDRPMVDYRSNCGNILSAVGPFAIEEGLVKAREPVTRVRIFQKNTGKLIIAEVPVKDGHFEEEGDYRIAGVPGSASRIDLHFIDPGGAVTGRLFPTGNLVDRLEVPSVGSVQATIMDAANPVVFIQAAQIGLIGTEIEQIHGNEALRTRFEAIRSCAAALMGLAASPEEATRKSQAIPKIAAVAPPRSYKTTGGEIIEQTRIDLLGRMMAMGTLHGAYAVSAAICTAGAACIEGTVVHEVLGPPKTQKQTLKIGHPGGVMEIGAVVRKEGGTWTYIEAILGRTARRLMEGHVLVPLKCFEKQ